MGEKKPNILLIMADQFRGDCLGISGHPDVKTPYLDTLASQGVWFDHAYSACPSCIAARAGLHTGMKPEHHKRVGYQDRVPWRYEHTLAGELAKAGYYTECVGKMHVYPTRNYLGFHHVDLHDGYLHCARYGSVPYRESQFVADDYFYWLKNEKGIAADVTESGIDCNSWVARPFQWEERFHPTNWVTDRSIDFMRRRDPDQPFFLMASYVRPHPPFDAPACYFDMYRDSQLTFPCIGDWADAGLLEEEGRFFNSHSGPQDPELIRQAQIGYYACITHLDHQIGRLLMALEEHELGNDTVILFTSDHGEMLCDHHLFRKALPYEGSARIPLIVSGNPKLTGMKPHTVNHNVVELCDIMPTLLEIAGADVPECVDGRSVLGAIREPDAPGNGIREYLHGEHSYAYPGNDLSNHYIVTQRDKFCWFSGTGREQYFVLEEDRQELYDKIDCPECQERIAYLRNCLIRELTGRPEGFTDGKKLIAGRNYPCYME